MGQHRNDGIDGPYMSVVVIVVIDTLAVHRVARRMGVHVEKMRVDLTRKSVTRMSGIDMFVLKRREKKREQQCQNRLDCRRLPHH